MGSRKTVTINGLTIGGSAPVRVESMLKTPLSDLEGCQADAEALRKTGCELARVSLPELSLAGNLKKLVESSSLTLMADIHFNHKLALAAIDAGCRAVRINPGNMSGAEGVREVVAAAKSSGVVIRIGANGGSLNNGQIEAAHGDRASALVRAVEEQLRILTDAGFTNLILSAKSSSVPETVKANCLLAQKYPFPFHIGITEAGGGRSGVVKGAAGISALLLQGVGDTIRVSLTGPDTDEVRTGYDILRALEIRSRGCNFISCPTCGRRRIDVAVLSERVKALLPEDLPDGLTIAVMGCEVNGPREAAGADLGIAGTPEGFVMFKKGVAQFSGPLECLAAELKKTLNSL